MKTKTVVFDLGKVLVDFDYGIAAHKLAANSAKDAPSIRAILDQSPLLFRYESAQITTPEFFAEARALIGFRGDLEEFAATFADIFTEIPAMIALHDGLRARGVPTFVLSNTNEIAIGHVRRRFPFFNTVCGHVLSYEHAVMKPDRAIYEATERLTGCAGGEILFIDDRPENVAAAQALGWQTICHRDPAETIPLVQRALA